MKLPFLVGSLLFTSAQAFSVQHVQTRSKSLLHLSSGMNVVLQPSSEPSAFDSFKIGSPRVHRYAQGGQLGETEYIMWYHGRSVDVESDKLPPLSTGRIGRALSKNGLVWKKDLMGSLAEDHPNVNLGLNKEEWWSFDTAHVGLGSVLMPMHNPAVITQGGVYMLYYMGGNMEESPMVDYLDKSVPDSMKDAKIAGMTMRIGVAISQDGVTFGRVEGEDPTGAIIAPYRKTDPNQRDNVPEGMKEELYCAWPEVVLDLDASDNNKAETFKMYYSTMTKDDKQKCIAYAVSEDGFRWKKKGFCLEPDDSGLDAAGCARCCVVRDAVYKDGAWEDLSGWKMYYEGVSPVDNRHRILIAESDDGKKWTKTGVALDVGPSDDSWDVAGVGAPHVLRMDDGQLRMYYVGQGRNGNTAIGVAKLQTDKNEWIREQASIVFAES